MFIADLAHLNSLRLHDTPPVQVRKYSDLGIEPILKLEFANFSKDSSKVRSEYLSDHTFTFKVEDLKAATFDAQVKEILKSELQKFHPFFQRGLDAVTTGGYTFILFDASDNKIPKEIIESMTGARAATDPINKKIYIKIGDQADFIASLTNELVHALYSKTGSTYTSEDPIRMGQELMKPSLEREQKGETAATSVEEDFYGIIIQEVCSRVIEEGINNVIKNKDFSFSYEDVANPSFAGLEKGYSIVIAKAVFGEVITERLRQASNGESGVQPEFAAFYTRLKRFLESDRCEKEVFEKLKTWGFKTS